MTIHRVGTATRRCDYGRAATLICWSWLETWPAAQAAGSFRRLAALDTDIAFFGHGEPITQDATAELRGAAQRLPGPSTPP